MLESGSKARWTDKENRDEKVFVCYELLMKQDGEYAPLLKKSHYYNKVGDIFNLSGDTVSRIVSRMLRTEIKGKEHVAKNLKIMMDIHNLVEKYKEAEE
jgi:hypothetical protein